MNNKTYCEICSKECLPGLRYHRNCTMTDKYKCMVKDCLEPKRSGIIFCVYHEVKWDKVRNQYNDIDSAVSAGLMEK